ncbi:MAG TPA: PepSY-associated TM helix domain-containing protein [Vicinamibacterales bacterium]|jgi:hypothetical protein|nr:PepSY-associated TM helix domain-containing protein [Vicinamibacterales bacterium]
MTETSLYRWTRDLHLYLGLFISPFLLVFSASVFFLNHAKVATDRPTSVVTFQNLFIPAGIDTAQGPAAIPIAQAIQYQTGMTGEIGFTRFVKATRHFVFPVSRPGLEASVDLDVDGRTALVSSRKTGMLEAFGYLHKMPGPHNANIRGNWVGIRAWKWFADATIYLTLFISVSGIYLWYTLRAERAIGKVLLTAGAVSLFWIIYAVNR